MARKSNTGRKTGTRKETRVRSNAKDAARGGTSRGARHLNDDIDAGDARDEDREFGHDMNFGAHREHRQENEQFGDVRRGDASGFGRPLSFQGKGFFGGGAPYEQSDPHIGMGNAVGYGPGRQVNGLTGGGYGTGGGFRGKGPKGYQRSDDRLIEDINERLTYDDDVDASEISVAVSGGEATLSGTVNSRHEKRRAEDLADDVSGITHVQNNLRVKKAPK